MKGGQGGGGGYQGRVDKEVENKVGWRRRSTKKGEKGDGEQGGGDHGRVDKGREGWEEVEKKEEGEVKR